MGNEHGNDHGSGAGASYTAYRTCPLCEAGCGLEVTVKDGAVTRIRGDRDDVFSSGFLCPKGSTLKQLHDDPDRVRRPMVKRDGVWEDVEWPVALEFVAAELKRIKDAHGAAAIGALATPHQTLEEMHLLQKLVRGLGSGNVDFRLRQADFSADGKRAGVPWLGMSISDFAQLDRVLVIGSTLRKDHPLLAHRLRQATKKGTELNIIHAVDDDLERPRAVVVRHQPRGRQDVLERLVAVDGAREPPVRARSRPGDSGFRRARAGDP